MSLHVLTVLVLGSGCCSCPGFHLRASDCSPGLAFCFMVPWTFAWICCLQLPYHPRKNMTHNTCFYSTGGQTPKFSAGLGRFGAGLALFQRFSSFERRFCRFECRFCRFKCWLGPLLCWVCLKGRKRERYKLSGDPLQAAPSDMLTDDSRDSRHMRSTTNRRIADCQHVASPMAGVPLQSLVVKFFPEYSPICCSEPWGISAEVFAEVFVVLPSKTSPKTLLKTSPQTSPRTRPKLPPLQNANFAQNFALQKHFAKASPAKSSEFPQTLMRALSSAPAPKHSLKLRPWSEFSLPSNFVLQTCRPNEIALRELGSYILRDTPKPWQLKAPGPKPTIKQVKEARKGDGPPRKGNQWPRITKGNGPHRNRNRGP